MTSVIGDYTFKSVFLTFFIRQVWPLKCRGACDNLPPLTLPLYKPGCVNTALINVLKIML